MQSFVHTNLEETLSLLERPSRNVLHLLDQVSEVFKDIKEKGDEALLHYTEKFDKISFSSKDIRVSNQEIFSSQDALSNELKNAIQQAKTNIEKFHSAQKSKALKVETMPGIVCERRAEAIEKVGLYIPGGTAPLFSTVLMLAVPAKIAGCEEIVLCSPANSEGGIHPAILYTASICGVKKIFKLGGSQAIAAMALGTESVPKTYKIFGPGNAFVTAAKQYASLLGTAIDMPAGPSEVMVIADEKADPRFVAIDLLSQAEHGADSQVVLLSKSQDLILETEKQVNVLLEELPRKELAGKSLENSFLVNVKSDQEALEICNTYAPEHLILNLEDPTFLKERVRNSGSVFVGEFTPESAGDYASGTNHTLPTGGASRQYSGVSLDSFLRYTTYQEISEKGLRELGPSIIQMAKAEGLDAHAKAVSLRLE